MPNTFTLRWRPVEFRSVSLTDISLGSVINSALAAQDISFFEKFRNARYYRLNFTEATNLRLQMTTCMFPYILRVLETSSLSLIAPVLLEESLDIRENSLPVLYEQLVGPSTHIIEVKSLYPRGCGSFRLETY